MNLHSIQHASYFAASEKLEAEAEKEQERDQERAEETLYRKRAKGVEEVRRSEHNRIADLLLNQIKDKKNRELGLLEENRSFHAEQQKKQEEEDVHVRSLALAMVSSI